MALGADLRMGRNSHLTNGNAVCYRVSMRKETCVCPVCGRWHKKREIVDTKQRAKTAAEARWGTEYKRATTSGVPCEKHKIRFCQVCGG